MTKEYIGIDYGKIGGSNRNIETGIHYGCISLNDLCDCIGDELIPAYPDELEINCKCGNNFNSKDSCDLCPDCESNRSVEYAWDTIESFGCTFEPYDKRYKAVFLESMNDLLITESPYYTHAIFCSPCVPGACTLTSPNPDGAKCYCFGPEYFENEKAPYPIYSVETGLIVE